MSHRFKSNRKPDPETEVRELASTIHTQEQLDAVLDQCTAGTRHAVFQKIWKYLGNPELIDKNEAIEANGHAPAD